MNPYQLSDEQKEKRQQDIDALAKNRDVASLLKKMGKDRAFLDRYFSHFKAYAETCRICRSCKGLEFCTMPLKGRAKLLNLDEAGYLSDRYVPCKHQKAYEASYAHQKNFRYSHLDEEQYAIAITPENLMKQSGEYVQAFTNVMSSSTQKKGVYLFGEPGTGKTWILCSLANTQAKKGEKIAFVRSSALVQDLTLNMYDKDYCQEVISILSGIPVLYLDDLGSERVSAWSRDSILLPILDARMNAGKKTYFSSNYNMDELESRLTMKPTAEERVAAMRFMERVRALSRPVLLSGHSQRT